MEFFVEQAVLDAGVKTVFSVMNGIDNHGESSEWNAYRQKKLAEFYELFKDVDVHEDEIIEGFNLLHDKTGVKRRKNLPSIQNLVKLLVKNRDIFYINKLVDIYNIHSLETKLSYGAHDLAKVSGNFTLRFTDGTERFQPLGQPEPIPINAHEYCYCDDDNEVLCRLEIRQVEKTAVTEDTNDVALLVIGNDATSWDMVRNAAEDLLVTVEKYCGGSGRIVEPTVY